MEQTHVVHTRWRLVLVIVFGATLSLSLAGSAGAGSATLRVGDFVSIGKSDVGCVVASGPVSLSCCPGLLTRKVPLRGYGVVISKDTAGIVQYITAAKDRIVLFRDEPTRPGKIFAKARKRPRQVFRLQAGDRILLGASDIACAVGKNHNVLFIGCYPATAKLDPIARSWGIYLSAHLAALTRFDKAGNVITTIHRANP